MRRMKVLSILMGVCAVAALCFSLSTRLRLAPVHSLESMHLNVSGRCFAPDYDVSVYSDDTWGAPEFEFGSFFTIERYGPCGKGFFASLVDLFDYKPAELHQMGMDGKIQEANRKKEFSFGAIGADTDRLEVRLRGREFTTTLNDSQGFYSAHPENSYLSTFSSVVRRIKCIVGQTMPYVDGLPTWDPSSSPVLFFNPAHWEELEKRGVSVQPSQNASTALVRIDFSKLPPGNYVEILDRCQWSVAPPGEELPPHFSFLASSKGSGAGFFEIEAGPSTHPGRIEHLQIEQRNAQGKLIETFVIKQQDLLRKP